MPKRIYDFAMMVSLKERVKRRNAKLHGEKIRIDGLSDEELLFEYVDLSASYEYQKRFFSFLLVAVLVTGITDIWKVFASFVYKALEQAVTQGICTEADMSAFLSMLFFACVLVTLSVLFLIIWYLKSMCLTHRLLLMVEEVKNTRTPRKM